MKINVSETIRIGIKGDRIWEGTDEWFIISQDRKYGAKYYHRFYRDNYETADELKNYINMALREIKEKHYDYCVFADNKLVMDL